MNTNIRSMGVTYQEDTQNAREHSSFLNRDPTPPPSLEMRNNDGSHAWSGLMFDGGRVCGVTDIDNNLRAMLRLPVHDGFGNSRQSTALNLGSSESSIIKVVHDRS